jgi:hypothetical protein
MESVLFVQLSCALVQSDCCCLSVSSPLRARLCRSLGRPAEASLLGKEKQKNSAKNGSGEGKESGSGVDGRNDAGVHRPGVLRWFGTTVNSRTPVSRNVPLFER